MGSTRKIGQEVVSFVTRRGVLCARLLKKRSDGTLHIADHFTMRKKRNGRTYYFPLPSTQRAAENVANEIDSFLDVRSNTMEMAIQKFTPERWERMNPTAKVATVGDVLTAHENAEKALGIEKITGSGYRGHLLVMFRQGLAKRRGEVLEDEVIKKMSLSEFDLRLVNDFKVARVETAGEDKTEQETKKRSANQVLRSVSAMFSEDAREHYTHLQLPPKLDDTIKRMFFRKVGKIKKRLPSGAVMRKIFGEAHQLRDGYLAENGARIEPDRNAYLAWLLAAHAGLRKKEITHAVREWVERGDKPRVWVRGTKNFKIKDKEERFAEVQPWVIDELDALCESPSKILSGTLTECDRDVFDRLNIWVKSKGLATEKKHDKGVHSLRFLFGSYLANKHGMYTAQKFLGHESPDTTNDHYADIMLDKTLYALWEDRPAWAAPAPKKLGEVAVIDA